jgi:hypothetical protein
MHNSHGRVVDCFANAAFVRGRTLRQQGNSLFAVPRITWDTMGAEGAAYPVRDEIVVKVEQAWSEHSSTYTKS